MPGTDIAARGEPALWMLGGALALGILMILGFLVLVVWNGALAFWPKPISLLQEGLINWQRLLGPRQITDAYLLALAVTHGGRFVTFDQRVAVEVVPGANASHLCVIRADGPGVC